MTETASREHTVTSPQGDLTGDDGHTGLDGMTGGSRVVSLGTQRLPVSAS
jgi:hypothetical protein